MIARLLSWWRHDPRLARHATLEAIRQEAALHPAEKGDHHGPDVPVLPAPGSREVSVLRPTRVPEARLRRAYQAPWPAR